MVPVVGATFNAILAGLSVYLYAEFGQQPAYLFSAVLTGLCAIGLFIIAAVD
jgi:hypothetical protein